MTEETSQVERATEPTAQAVELKVLRCPLCEQEWARTDGVALFMGTLRLTGAIVVRCGTVTSAGTCQGKREMNFRGEHVYAKRARHSLAVARANHQ